VSLEVVKKSGLDFATLVCLARCNGLAVAAYRSCHSSEEAFRAKLRKNMRGETMFMIASYSRATLGQSGDGWVAPGCRGG
jgi:hypothetical protein